MSYAAIGRSGEQRREELPGKLGKCHPWAACSAWNSKVLGAQASQESTLGLQWPPENTGFSHSPGLQILYKFLLLANSRLEFYRDGKGDKCSWLLFCNTEKTLERSHGDAKLTTSNPNRGTFGTIKFGQRKYCISHLHGSGLNHVYSNISASSAFSLCHTSWFFFPLFK